MTLTVTPNPVKIGNGVAIVGAGFTPDVQTRIKLDNNTIETFISEPDGSFAVGAIVSTIPKTQTVLVQQFTANAWHNVGSVTVSVVGAGPTISQVIATAIMQNGATVSWTLNEKATGQVEYGLTTAYGNLSTPETSLNYSAHVQKLSGLSPNTLYHFRVKSTNAAGGTSVSGDFTFITLASTSLPPAPTLTGTVGTVVGTASDNLTWTGGTNVATYRVYRDGVLIASPNTPNFTDTDVVSGQTYAYQVSAVNAAGEGPKSNTVSVTPVIVQPVPPPQTPLQIIALSATPTGDGATISWSLSANATGQVAYGPTSSYGSLTTKESNLVSSHTQTIKNQGSASVIHFQVISTDANNNTVKSDDATFTVLTANTPPPPPPPSTGRPWPLPTVNNTVSVPSSIDKTGATDVTAALNSFLNGVPNNSTINFPPAPAIYKISSCLDLRGKSNWIVEGNGCTLNNVGNANSGDANTKSFWATQIPTVHSGAASAHITIRNFTAKGASPSPGTFQSGEFAAFLHVYGNPAEVYSTTTGCYFEVSGITASGLFGDLVTLNQAANFAWVHDNNVIDCGRNSVSVVWAANVLIESNQFGKIGYSTFDIEPESGSGGTGVFNIIFRNNTCGSWTNTFLSAAGSTTDIHDVIIDGNTITNGTLFTIINVARRENITFTNNVSKKTGSGPLLQFVHVDGLVVQHNTQPLSSGSLVSISDCPGAVITPNP